VVANVRERLAVNKQRSHRFIKERFNLKKLNEVERFEVSNRFAALENSDAEVLCLQYLGNYHTEDVVPL
jgi:hypothetical protein